MACLIKNNKLFLKINKAIIRFASFVNKEKRKRKFCKTCPHKYKLDLKLHKSKLVVL